MVEARQKRIFWKANPYPVLVPGQLFGELDSFRVSSPCIIQQDDNLFLYYWAGGKKGNLILAAQCDWKEFNKWKPINGIMLGPQNENYNIEGPSFPFVLKLDEKNWYMYFVAWGKKHDFRIPNSTGLAISKDSGRTWRYYDKNPILVFDKPWDKEGTGSVCIIRKGNEYWMYYTAISRYYQKPQGVKSGHGEIIPEICIGLAFSKDGINWKKYDKPVLCPRKFDAEPYEYIVSKPFVMKDGNIYRMWFNSFGHHYRIQEAISFDGINFEFTTNHLDDYFGVGKQGNFDDQQRSYPFVIKKQDLYHMWYTGNNFGATGIGYAEGVLWDTDQNSSHAST